MHVQHMIDNVQLKKLAQWIQKDNPSLELLTSSGLYAASTGMTTVLNLLFFNGVNIHNDDEIYLMYATYHNRIETMEYLLNNGANPNARNGMILIYAIQNHNIKTLNKLIEYGATFNIDMIVRVLVDGNHENIQLLADTIDEDLWVPNNLYARIINENGSLQNFETVYNILNTPADGSIYNLAMQHEREDILNILPPDPRIRGNNLFIVEEDPSNDILLYTIKNHDLQGLISLYRQGYILSSKHIQEIINSQDYPMIEFLHQRKIGKHNPELWDRIVQFLDDNYTSEVILIDE